MSRFASGPALFALAALLFAPRAGAYCRTITTPLPADYDPSAGCYVPTSREIPLWWSNACVGFSVQQAASKQITYAQADAAVGKAFALWSAASCPGGGSPSITASDNGPVACDVVEYSQVGSNQHAILFRDTSWPYDDPNNTLALTTVTFDNDTGELYDADVEVNTAQNTIVAGTNVPANAFGFDTIITHEAGHFLGLAHTPIETAVMFAHYKPASLALTSDDIDGICTIYPSNGDRSTSFSGATSPEVACDPTPRHGFGSACGSLAAPTPTTTTTSHCSVGDTPGSSTSDWGWITLGALTAACAIGRRAGAKLKPMKRTRAFMVATALGVAGGALASIAVEHVASASVSIAVMLDELVRDSTAAAIGTPVEQKSVWSNGRIYTYTRVHVDRSVVGSLDTDSAPGANDASIWVRTMGGAVDHVGQLVDGEAVFTVGRPALLFVQPLESEGHGVYVVTARGQGQFPVLLAKDGKTLELVRSSSAAGLMPPPPSRVAALTATRAQVGISVAPPLASEALHHRPVEDALGDVTAAWARIHASP